VTEGIRTDVAGRLRFVGMRETFDLTVEGANHYISSFGIVNANTHIGFDEAIQFTKTQYDMLRGRLRSDDPILVNKLRIILATNPDAPFEGLWVKERFVDPAPQGRKLLSQTVNLDDGSSCTLTRIYIPARLSDNPNRQFARDYEASLRTLPAHIRKARLEGDWSAVEGAFFESEWNPSVHVVEPFEIPAHYPRFRIMDWGYKSPCPVMWGATDEEGNIILYREVTYNYKVKEPQRKDAELVAMAIKKLERQHGEWDERRQCSKLTGPADTQIWERRGTVGPSIVETMATYGVYWQPCTKDRLAATSELLRRLKDVPKSKNSRPGLIVFNTCVNLIRTMPTIKTDPANPELPMDGGDDHWLDCLMYACMYRSPTADAKRKAFEEDEVSDLAQARVTKQRRWGYGI
jgi:hypothetical protein